MSRARLQARLRTVRRLVFQSLFERRIYSPRSLQQVVDEFHKLYYDASLYGGTWRDTYWRGVRVAKCPFDLWIYQELVFELKPDVVIECGTARGGSALYLASLLDLVGKGRVVTIDAEPEAGRPVHDRITYLSGSSTSPETVERVNEIVRGLPDERTVLVALDSDHSKQHVLDELRIYSAFVTPGSYVVVEDSNLNGHPVEPRFGPGPMEAIAEFLRENREFVADRGREKYYLTFNPSGYLRKLS